MEKKVVKKRVSIKIIKSRCIYLNKQNECGDRYYHLNLNDMNVTKVTNCCGKVYEYVEYNELYDRVNLIYNLREDDVARNKFIYLIAKCKKSLLFELEDGDPIENRTIDIKIDQKKYKYMLPVSHLTKLFNRMNFRYTNKQLEEYNKNEDNLVVIPLISIESIAKDEYKCSYYNIAENKYFFGDIIKREEDNK